MDDASLDEFLPAEDGEEDEEAETTGADPGTAEADPEEKPDPGAADTDPAEEPDPDGEDSAVESATLDPAVSTYAWRGEPAACAACGEAVGRRWRDGDDLVCVDCKEW